MASYLDQRLSNLRSDNMPLHSQVNSSAMNVSNAYPNIMVAPPQHIPTTVHSNMDRNYGQHVSFGNNHISGPNMQGSMINGSGIITHSPVV